MRVVIIGAGPAGLVTAKSLLEAATPDFPFQPVVLEQESDIGGTFRFRTYENATLVSSKQLTSFSDYRLPLEHPDHLTLEQYVNYLRGYCSHFNLTSRIQLDSKVVHVSRNPAGGHVVSYVTRSAAGAWDYDDIQHLDAAYVAVCTGLHVIPSVPTIPGIEHVLKQPKAEQPGAPKPAAYHSADYKSRSQLAGRHVMILGTGETGMDLAYEAAKAGAKEVVLCSRGGFLSFPKALNDFEIFGYQFKSDKASVPIDSLITNLGETAYVHPWVASAHIRWFVSDFVIKRILWFLTGTQAGCNQWVGELEPERLGRAYVFLNKSHKAMPYINRPYRNRPAILDYMSRYIDPPEDMPPQTDFAVELAPFPSHFLPNGRAVFPLSKRKDAIRMQTKDVRPDLVIYATGYRQEFSFLDKDGGYATAGEADVRNIVKSGDESVAFIGFVRPGVGAIPPIAEMQSFFWISLIKGQIKLPLPPPHYHLLVKETARIKYGVDHSSYMSTLAKDIGAAPGLLELWWQHGTHVLVCYCFGAAFTTFYRLVGPYRSPQAASITKTELWDTVTRRGIAGNFIMGLIPMVFYLTLNAFAFAFEMVLTLGGFIRF